LVLIQCFGGMAPEWGPPQISNRPVAFRWEVTGGQLSPRWGRGDGGPGLPLESKGLAKGGRVARREPHDMGWSSGPGARHSKTPTEKEKKKKKKKKNKKKKKKKKKKEKRTVYLYFAFV
jgi:hypothetical protein